MNETYKIRTWGGSLAVILPQKVVRTLSLKAGHEVKIRIVNIGMGGDVVIEPQRREPKNGRSKRR
jgi:antitoxin component of MazEF toxin-antitoxin module